MTNEIKNFKRKNHGEIVYIAVSVCLLATAILLMIQSNISQTEIEVGVRFFFLVVGIGLGLGYYFNKRSSFRPSWTLPMSVVLTLLSLVFIVTYYSPNLKNPSISLSLITIIISAFNGSIILSTAFQLKGLTLKRRYFQYCFAFLFFLFAILGYFDVFGIRSNNQYAIIGYCIILAIASFFEGTYDLLKSKTVKL